MNNCDKTGTINSSKSETNVINSDHCVDCKTIINVRLTIPITYIYIPVKRASYCCNKCGVFDGR
jgi:hypothetical protein